MPEATVNLRNSYNEQVRYDANGNITSLKRNGESDNETATITIDDLTYSYTGNRLIRVTDSTNHPKGFKDSSDNNGDDYTYYDNGDLKTDKNKAIVTPIKYNHLNLPVEIVFNDKSTTKINYLYDGEGKKLKKIVTNGSSVTTTDYLSGYQYQNGVLEFFPTSEGYVKCTVSGEVTAYNYVFNYTDHLGNVRVSYTLDPADNAVKIMEENHYYPFGLKHNGYSPTQKIFVKSTPPNIVLTPVVKPEDVTYKYKYNGKELQDELGLDLYDYGARNYDPAIGRWLNIDPLAETSRRFSPYVYALNNPVYFIDPDGMEATDSKVDMTDPNANLRVNVKPEVKVDIGYGRMVSGNNLSIAATFSIDFGKGSSYAPEDEMQDNSNSTNPQYKEAGAKPGEVLNFDISLLDRFKDSGIDPEAKVEGDKNKAIALVLKKIRGLNAYYKAMGSPKITDQGRSSEGNRGFTFPDNTIGLYNGAYVSYFMLASTTFHELTHIHQYIGLPGNLHDRERQAYRVEWKLGDPSLKRKYQREYKSIWNQTYGYDKPYPY